MSEKRYVQIIYLINDFYPEYIKNTYHSTIRKINHSLKERRDEKYFTKKQDMNGK